MKTAGQKGVPVPTLVTTTGQASGSNVPVTSEEARTFLQERLAFLGRAYSVIGLTFMAVGNLIASNFEHHSWANATTLPVLVANLTYAAPWLLCRRGRRSAPLLHIIDGLSVMVAAACSALLVFSNFPGEVEGLSYSRALLLFTFGLVLRAIVVPSSTRRTLVLGLIASIFPVTTTHAWFAAATPAIVPPSLASFFTASWCLGAVVISTLASHVIFGLRQEIREARQLGQYTLVEKI